jgi:hypothetical protein
MQAISTDSYGTCFPKTEDLLNETDYQEALEEIGSRKSMDRYRSMMDFLLCELKPSYRAGCSRFYQQKGPRLVQIENEKELERLDNFLSGALMIALEMKRQGVHTSWKGFCQTITAVAA